MQAESDKCQRHHLLIAGTGRAGTSALVRYLTGLGLDTHLSRRGTDAQWYEAAEAGLEDIPLSAVSSDAPYVVKSPWSYQFAQEMLDDPGIVLDAVIVPVRNLVEAASSRSICELHELHKAASWMAEVASTWEHWGTTPGGVIYSLNPVDVARLLAVGFHRLIERLVQADVPIVLLAFPRFAADPDYLHRRLAPVLPIAAPEELAREVHHATFHVEKIRVGRELDAPDEPPSVGKVRGPSLAALEIMALKREVITFREQLSTARAERDALHARLEREATREAEAEAARDAPKNAAEHRRVVAKDQLATEQAEKDRVRDERVQLEREIAALRASRSWRITWPLRVLGSLVRTLTGFWGTSRFLAHLPLLAHHLPAQLQ